MGRFINGFAVDKDRRCEATVKGRQCKNPPAVDSLLCPVHDPKLPKPPTAAERQGSLMARRGITYLPGERRKRSSEL
jgi:hypothetical protein